MTGPSNAAARRRRAAVIARRHRASARNPRERILATADRLFYRNGIQAVGVQLLLEESDVTRVTFYRHFPSKDDLVLAYLDRRGTQARAAVQRILDAHPGDPRGALHAWAVAFTEDGQVDEYRGCTFVNAAAEYGEPDHPVRLMAIGQRRWINQVTEDLLIQAGHPEPQAATRALLALRTGYVFSTGLEEDTGWAGQFLAAHDRLVSPPSTMAAMAPANADPGKDRDKDLVRPEQSPEQSAEDTDAGWGEAPESGDDDRYYRDRPPHWGSD